MHTQEPPEGGPGDPELRRAELEAEIQRLREACAAAEARADAAVAASESLVATVSHELRTPLATITMGLDLVRRRLAHGEVDPRWLDERMQRAQSAAARLDRLIRRFLDVAQIGEGGLRANRQRLDLVPLVHEVIERLHEELVWARCEVAVEAPSSVVGSWDALQVEQILVNLLTNAIRHAAGCPVAVRVTPEAGQVRLEVSDRGPGIPLDQRRRLFERFGRGAGGVGGVGLGLWIARHLAEANGGSVELDSVAGDGATFRVFLPLGRSVAGQQGS